MIEGAAKNLSSVYHDQWTGTFGDYGVFTFNLIKIITTSDGGVLVFSNEEAVTKVKYWAPQQENQNVIMNIKKLDRYKFSSKIFRK